MATRRSPVTGFPSTGRRATTATAAPHLTLEIPNSPRLIPELAYLHQVYRVDVDVNPAEIQSLGPGLAQGFPEKRL